MALSEKSLYSNVNGRGIQRNDVTSSTKPIKSRYSFKLKVKLYQGKKVTLDPVYPKLKRSKSCPYIRKSKGVASNELRLHPQKRISIQENQVKECHDGIKIGEGLKNSKDIQVLIDQLNKTDMKPGNLKFLNLF